MRLRSPPRHAVRCALLAIGLSAAGCRPATLDKQPPIDLAAIPSPTAGDFNVEGALEANWEAVLRPRWEAGDSGTLLGVGGKRLAYHHVAADAPARGAVVVLTGRSEPVLKYAELVDDLARHGYSVWLLDHRGQGASERLTTDPERGHVESFTAYADDLETFLAMVVRPAEGEQPYLLAHSMGGAVALMHADLYPESFRAIVVSAPMIEVDTGAFPPMVAGSLALAACSATDATAYILGGRGYVSEPFEANRVTSSAARWDFATARWTDHPELRLGSPTWGWLCAALTGGAAIQKTARYNVTPVLMLQAGDDSFVKAGGQEHYCREAPRCQLLRYEEGRHELLQERDEIRNDALAQALRFFSAFEE